MNKARLVTLFIILFSLALSACDSQPQYSDAVTYVDGSHLDNSNVPYATPIPNLKELQPGEYEVIGDKFFVNFGTSEGTLLFFIWNAYSYYNEPIERSIIDSLINQKTLSAEDLAAIEYRQPPVGYLASAAQCFAAIGQQGKNVPIIDSKNNQYHDAMLVVSGKSFNWLQDDSGNTVRGPIMRCIPHNGNPQKFDLEDQMNRVLKTQDGLNYQYLNLGVYGGNQGFLQPQDNFVAAYDGAIKGANSCSKMILEEGDDGNWYQDYDNQPGSSRVYIDMNQSFSIRYANGYIRYLSCYPKTQLLYPTP